MVQILLFWGCVPLKRSVFYFPVFSLTALSSKRGGSAYTSEGGIWGVFACVVCGGRNHFFIGFSGAHRFFGGGPFVSTDVADYYKIKIKDSNKKRNVKTR